MIYTTLEAYESDMHGMWESSNLKSTDIGNLYDALVLDKDASEKTAKPIDVDNGVALKIGEYTGNGLQERYAIVATDVKSKIAVTGTPVLIKDAFTRYQEQPFHFYNKAGKDAKAYEVVEEDIFAIAEWQFTDKPENGLEVGQYVVIKGDGTWKAQTAAPAVTGYGFIGKIHSISVGDFYTIVRIFTVQNKQL